MKQYYDLLLMKLERMEPEDRRQFLEDMREQYARRRFRGLWFWAVS